MCLPHINKEREKKKRTEIATTTKRILTNCDPICSEKTQESLKKQDIKNKQKNI